MDLRHRLRALSCIVLLSSCSSDGTTPDSTSSGNDGRTDAVSLTDDLGGSATPPAIPDDREPREPPVLLDGSGWYLESRRSAEGDVRVEVPSVERTAHGLAFAIGGGFFVRSTCFRFYDGYLDYDGERLTTRRNARRGFDGCPATEDGAPANAVTAALRDAFRTGGVFALDWRGETLGVTSEEGARFVFRDARSTAFPVPAEVTLELLGRDWFLASYRRADGGEVSLPPSEAFPPRLRFPDLAPVIDTLDVVSGGSAFGARYTLSGASIAISRVDEEGIDLAAPPSGAVERATDTVRRVLSSETPLTIERGEDRLAIVAETGERLDFRESGVARFWRDTSERLEIDVVRGGDPAATPRSTIAVERAVLNAGTLRLLSSIDRSVREPTSPLAPCDAPIGSIHVARSIDASGEITTIVGENACAPVDRTPSEGVWRIDGMVWPRLLSELAERVF